MEIDFIACSPLASCNSQLVHTTLMAKRQRGQRVEDGFLKGLSPRKGLANSAWPGDCRKVVQTSSELSVRTAFCRTVHPCGARAQRAGASLEAAMPREKPTMSLDAAGQRTGYSEVKAAIRAMIERGGWKPGVKLPSEREL